MREKIKYGSLSDRKKEQGVSHRFAKAVGPRPADVKGAAERAETEAAGAVLPRSQDAGCPGPRGCFTWDRLSGHRRPQLFNGKIKTYLL